MFHVERSLRSTVKKEKIVFIAFFLALLSCAGTKQRTQISDYILVPNGMPILGSKNLTAFVFENNLKKLPIELFLSEKFKTDNYAQNEFWVTIEKEKFKIIIYDYADFEKYINSSNYAVINFDPEDEKNGDKRDFIAISMINAYNEDCLLSSSIYQNLALNYLKKLKYEYCNQ